MSIRPNTVQRALIVQFVAGTPARTAAQLVGVNRHTATLFYTKLRELIALHLAQETPLFWGQVEVDESYFGGVRKGKRGRGAAGKAVVFGLLKRAGRVHMLIPTKPPGDSEILSPIDSDMMSPRVRSLAG